jgi:predicted Rossmann fold flavoprotein
MKQIGILGGGAAGYFGAIQIARLLKGEANIVLLEKGNEPLTKVKISGGGRCNVTHNLFDPVALSEKYPRGSKELRGAFERFQPKDTIQWFESHGVKLKAEADGRMFPITNTSSTILDCLINEAEKEGVKEVFVMGNILPSASAFNLTPWLSNHWIVSFGWKRSKAPLSSLEPRGYFSDNATGSNKL